MATRTPSGPRTDLLRSLTLLRVFLVASAAILAVGALALSTLMTSALRGQALEDARVSLTQYVNGVLHDELVADGRVEVSTVDQAVSRDLRTRADVLSVKVWAADGTLAWTNVAPERIGRTFPLEGHLAEAVLDGKAEAELEELHGAENEVEAALAGGGEVVEVYAPIADDAGRPIGAYEIYADASRLRETVGERSRQLWLFVLAVFLLLWTALAVLVRGASSRLRRQTRTLRQRSEQLLESYRELEQSSVEAIETLNATVEAKDPYTAGHSARVQQIAVAIGGELGLDGGRLATLGHAALFHDIGKIAVPDAILTKPTRLDAEEFEVMQRHSAQGAEIVGRLRRLRDAVPLIRHHHERWDGTGYPDCLAGEEIPLEAAVLGLADAWDAMTTDRPYHRALTLEEAFREVRAHRGTQFSPAVVDAFLAAARRTPGEFAPVGDPAQPLADAG